MNYDLPDVGDIIHVRTLYDDKCVAAIVIDNTVQGKLNYVDFQVATFSPSHAAMLPVRGSWVNANTNWHPKELCEYGRLKNMAHPIERKTSVSTS